MHYDENHEKAAQYLKKVVPKLVEFKLPTNPINYAVWYEYISGRNTQLIQEIDSIISNTTHFSKEICRDLYYRHILIIDSEEITKVNNEIKQAFVELIEGIKFLSDDNQEFVDLLTDQAQIINSDIDIETFKYEIRKTIEASETIKNSSKEYQRKFVNKARELEKLKIEFEMIRKEANTDSLTQVNNRKAFNEQLHSVMLTALQEKSPLCLAIIDIDHFKIFNDTYGHLTGDQVLRYVSKLMTDNIKGKDFIARFGGEEFAIILPDTELAGATSISNNIRKIIAKNKIINKAKKQNLGHINVSIGVTQYINGENSTTFIARADAALYEAKNNGRNQVISTTID